MQSSRDDGSHADYMSYQDGPFPWQKKYPLPNSSKKRIEDFALEFQKQIDELSKLEKLNQPKTLMDILKDFFEPKIHHMPRVQNRIKEEEEKLQRYKRSSINTTVAKPSSLTSPFELHLADIRKLGAVYFAENIHANDKKAANFKYAYVLENLEPPEFELPIGNEESLQNITIPPGSQLLWEKLIGFYLALPNAENPLAVAIDKLFENAFKKWIPYGHIVKEKPIADLALEMSPEEICLQFKSLLARIYAPDPTELQRLVTRENISAELETKVSLSSVGYFKTNSSAERNNENQSSLNSEIKNSPQ